MLYQGGIIGGYDEKDVDEEMDYAKRASSPQGLEFLGAHSALKLYLIKT